MDPTNLSKAFLDHLYERIAKGMGIPGAFMRDAAAEPVYRHQIRQKARQCGSRPYGVSSGFGLPFAFGLCEVPPVMGYRVEHCEDDYVIYYNRSGETFLLQLEPRQLLRASRSGPNTWTAHRNTGIPV